MVILFSCEKSIKNEKNRESDIVYAKSLVKNFYDDCDSKRIDKLYKSISIEIDTNVIGRVIFIKDSLGFHMNNYKIDNIETYYTESKQGDSVIKKLEVHAFIKAYNDNKIISENLNFMKINDESPKIIGYHIKG